MSKPTPEKVSIKPCGDLRVRKPNGQLLDPAGESVAWNAYWRRRELDQDIERTTTETEPAPEPEPEVEIEPPAKPDAPVRANAKIKPVAAPQPNAE